MKQSATPLSVKQAVAGGLNVFMPGVLDDFCRLRPSRAFEVYSFHRDLRAIRLMADELAVKHSITPVQAEDCIRYSLKCLGVSV